MISSFILVVLIVSVVFLILCPLVVAIMKFLGKRMKEYPLTKETFEIIVKMQRATKTSLIVAGIVGIVLLSFTIIAKFYLTKFFEVMLYLLLLCGSWTLLQFSSYYSVLRYVNIGKEKPEKNNSIETI